MSMPFLTAQWRQLVLVNYAVEPALLERFVPACTHLDIYQGACYVSLVGFLFTDTRVRGIRYPLHASFEEVNLRYYVLRKMPDGTVKRGVAFIQEIVPKRAVTWIARWIYGEPYRTRPMRHRWAQDANHRTVGYGWKDRGRWNTMEVKAGADAVEFIHGSKEEFITEHYWGYINLGPTRTREYEVRHPKWNVYPVKGSTVDVDFAAAYGERFGALSSQRPDSVMLAEGSPVVVMPRILVA